MFQNPFSFNGRIRRTEYVISIFIFVIVYSTFAIIGAEISSFFPNLFVLIGLITSIFFISAQGAKRCHDMGNSGWCQIIPFYMLWMLFARSVDESNVYESNPRTKGTPVKNEEILNNGDHDRNILTLYDLKLREIEKKQSLLYKSEANGLLTPAEVVEKYKYLNLEKAEILKNKTNYELRSKAESNCENKIKALTALKDNGLINSTEYDLKIEDLIKKEIELIKKSSQ